MLRACLTSLLVALAFLGASPALADHPGEPLNDPTTLRYISYAHQFYRQPLGCSHAVLGVPAGRPQGSSAGWGEQPGCSIWVDPAFWPYLGRERQAEYCGLILHEVGHNLGFSHTIGRANWPMDEKTRWAHPGCWAPKHVLHRHRHRHRSGRIHHHRHYHLKVGQP